MCLVIFKTFFLLIVTKQSAADKNQAFNRKETPVSSEKSHSALSGVSLSSFCNMIQAAITDEEDKIKAGRRQ